MLLGLGLLLVCGLAGLLHTHGKPAAIQAATRHPSAVDESRRQRPTTRLFTGEIDDLDPYDTPARIGAPVMRDAINGFLGFGPDTNDLQTLGRYPREPWRKLLKLWRDQMPGWSQLTIEHVVFSREGETRIVWRAEPGLSAEMSDGQVYALDTDRQWHLQTRWPGAPASHITVSLKHYTGRIWPKAAGMVDFDAASPLPQPDGSILRIAPGAIKNEILCFVGLHGGRSRTLRLNGIDGEQIARWMEIWEQQHPEYDGMDLGGIVVWRTGDSCRVELHGPLTLEMWDASRYRIYPDGTWLWLERGQTSRSENLVIRWLQSGKPDAPGPTAINNATLATPWELLDLD